MRYLLLPLFLLLVTAAGAQIDPGYRTTLVGKIDPAGPRSGPRYSSLTGYVAPDGREYALLGGFEGTYVIDVTSTPFRTVTFIPGSPSMWREMKTYRTYAYVVTEGSGRSPAGLQILDLSRLPDTATLARTDFSLFQKAHTITQEGDYIYVHGTNVEAGANGGTIIYNVADDPLHPRRVGAWSAHYVHDATVRNDTLYAAAIEDGQLDIVYLGRDRRSPRLVAEIRYPNAGTHNSAVTIDGGYVMTTDEVNGTPKTLKVWDLRDRGNLDLSKVADYTPVPGEIIHNVHVKGTLAYVSWYTAGTRIIDISDPRNPAQVGFYDTHPGAGPSMNGNWEVYPYLPSGKILASDMQTGLHVFTFDGATRGFATGLVRDEKTGAPLGGATIRSTRYGMTTTSDVDGRFRFEGAADTLDVLVIRDGYYAREARLRIAPGGASSEIRMRPLEFTEVSIRAIDSASGAPVTGFAWKLASGAQQGSSDGDHVTLSFVKDSSRAVMVGAWGYLPKLVSISSLETSVDVPLARGYADDAELDLGWSLSAPDDDALEGRWERASLIATDIDGRAMQPGQDASAGDGNHAFFTGIIDSPDASTSDIDDGATTLTSPRFDLTGYRLPAIECMLWYVNDGNPFADDTLLVRISNDDGDSWMPLATLSSSLFGWTPFHFPIPELMTPTSRMRFRIVASDRIAETSMFGSVVEAGLDDFRIVEEVVAAAPIAAGSARATAVVRPNPLNGPGVLEIGLPGAEPHLRVELFDGLGRLVSVLHDGPVSARLSLPIDAAGLPAGRYSWRATHVDGTVTTGAIAVVH